jgi:polyisoprenoid-binding protein YceI
MGKNDWFARLALAAAALAGPLAAHAQQGVLPDKSEIRFVSRQMNVPVEGRFKRFTAKVAFDAARPETSRAEFAVDLNSVDLGSAEAETEVKRDGWFDTARSPQATFVSTAVKSTGPGKYEVQGKLTIKGTTRDITVPIATHAAGAQTFAEGRFVIKRMDYRIGEGPWADLSVVGNDVEVRVKLALAPK